MTYTHTHTQNLLACFFLQKLMVDPKFEIKDEIDIKEEFLDDEEEYMENEQPLVLDDDDDQVLYLSFGIFASQVSTLHFLFHEKVLNYSLAAY